MSSPLSWDAMAGLIEPVAFRLDGRGEGEGARLVRALAAECVRLRAVEAERDAALGIGPGMNPGPVADCPDCGRKMVWSGPGKQPVWMCPRCTRADRDHLAAERDEWRESQQAACAELAETREELKATHARLVAEVATANRLAAELAAHSAPRAWIEEYIARQQHWSSETFGPGRRTGGITKHIAKELDEIRVAPNDLEEWVDVLILGLDGAWRSGHTPAEIVEGLRLKQAMNFAREWPPPGPEDEPNEHVRAAEAERDRLAAKLADAQENARGLLQLHRLAIDALRAEQKAHAHRRICGKCQNPNLPGNGCLMHGEMMVTAAATRDALLAAVEGFNAPD